MDRRGGSRRAKGGRVTSEIYGLCELNGLCEMRYNFICQINSYTFIRQINGLCEMRRACHAKHGKA